jgi:protein gp37
MTKTGIPYLDFCCNPGGCGCSNGCDGCWAERLAPRIGKIIGCQDCRGFKVHFHPERLVEPARRKKPAVIGVQFTGELFDKERPVGDILKTLDALYAAPQHNYVFLTQQIEAAKDMFWLWMNQQQLKLLPDNWIIGVTVRNQKELEDRGPVLLDIIGNHWLSIEPIRGRIELGDIVQNLCGVIVGVDNRPKNTVPKAYIYQILLDCKDAGVPCYIKQLHLWACPRCGGMLDISQSFECPECKMNRSEFQYSLVTDPEKFPEPLRVRELPWTLTTKS